MGSNQSKKRAERSLSSRKGVHFEALEPRILFDASAGGAPTAEVSVSTGELTANEDQLLNDNIEFNLTFDNNGGQEGYVPYIDFLALPEMVIENVTGFGSDLDNPSGAGTEPIGVIAGDGQLIDINTGLPINHPMYETSIGSPSSDFFGGAGSETDPVFYDLSLVGYYLYSVELPFGSYTPGNPPAEVTVEASLNDADGIIPGDDYELVARGAFALGCDALDNPGTEAAPDDAPIFGGFDSALAIPQVLSLTKSAGVAEGEGQFTGENVSGPNHPVTYSLRIDIAEGETINNLRLTDILPPNLAYLGNLTVTGGTLSSINSEPEESTNFIDGVPASDNLLDLNFAPITGGAGTDIVITYDAFVAYVEDGGGLVIDPVSGQENDDDFNDAAVAGDWTNDLGATFGVSDNAGTLIPGIDPDGAISTLETDYQIDEHSLAIQKGVGFAPGGGDRAASGWSEGDVAEFSMNFQISDYFAFGSLIVTDTMGDGLEFLPALGVGTAWPNAADFDNDALEIRPVLTFTMHKDSGAGPEDITVSFDEDNFTAIENSDGTTGIIFDVYQQLVDSGFITAGDALTGGMIPNAGLGVAPMGDFNSGIGTVGSISYRAKVRNEYLGAVPGNTEINQGDTLDNNVVIEGENLNVDDLTTTNVDVTDGSGTNIQIVTGSVTKELFSATRNGDQRLASNLDGGLEVVPGDVITWRIVYELPITEFEGLTITDYLPLPVFDANEIDLTQVYDYDPTGYLTGGRVSFGPLDTFTGSEGEDEIGDGGIDDDPNYDTPIAPTLTLDAPNNAFTVNFGDYDIPESEDPVARTIELFVSTTITDEVYAEGLRFTNQVGTTESNSFAATVASNEISQITLGVPDLTITKGVLSVDSTSGGSLSGSRGPTGVVFNAPGSPDAFDTTTGDPIISNSLDDDPDTVAVGDEALINADLVNADAGDVVTFGITVQNRGSADFGAFDVEISDTLPAGFEVPSTLAELNLRVTDGTGATIDYEVLDDLGNVVGTSVGGVLTPSGVSTEADVIDAFFEGSIELVDPTDNTGALAEYDGASGDNLALIAYDLVVEGSAVINSTLTNTATVENFSYRNGGPNYAEPEDTDTASVSIIRPTVVKEVVETSHVTTSNEEIDPTPAPGDPTGRSDDNRAEVAIGEVVTYTVTIDIPEGTLPSVVIRDTIQPGMAFVGVESIAFDPGLTTSKGTGDFSDVDVYYNADLSRIQLGVGGTAGLGEIVNTNTDNTVPEQVTFTYKAVVLNDAVNQRGVIRSNDAEIRWQEGGNTLVEDDSVDVRVVEPNISVNKSLRNTPAAVEGADTVTYRIVVRNNDSGGNTSEGYDVELSDFLPDDVTFISANYVNGANGLAPDTAISYNAGAGSNGELTAAWNTFDVGRIARFDVVVRVNDALLTDTVITNTAEVEFTSLPGERGDVGHNGYDPATDSGSFSPPPVPGPTDPDPLEDAFERTGDPGDPGDTANDYNRQNSAVVTVINPVGIDKVVIETSEDHTAEETTAAGDVQVAIGEVVRYEVRIRVPQANSTDLELVDVLGAGLEWIPAASNDIQFRLEGFNPDGSTISASAYTAPQLSAALTGNTDFPDSNVSFNGASNTVTFDFGDIVNTETDSAEEFIYISYNAIVQNKDPNDLVDPGVTRGATLTNTVQLREGGVDIGAPLTQEVTVVEPDLTISKSDNGTTTADAGDVIDYTLTITAGTSIPQLHSTAFDLSIEDALPDQLELVGGSVSFVGLPGTSIGAIVENVAGDSFTATVDRLEPGETFQITFQGTVRDTGANIISADETVTNTASLVYSTLPDDGTDATTNGGTLGNETGNEAGTPGDTDGERITTRSNSDSFASPNPILTKVLANPADTTFTIGEPVEYVITLTVPEGQTGGSLASIVDTIDSGFRFVPGTLSVTQGAGVTVATAGTLIEANNAFFTFTDPGNAASSEELRFDFGSVTFNDANAADGLNTGTIEIRYQLQVENILANQQGDTLNNTADFLYTDGDSAATVTLQDVDDTDTIITIVEPQVDAAKTITTLPSPAQAGETVEYRVTLTNPGGAGNPLQNVTAFEVTAQDTVPTGLTFDQTSFSALIGSTDITGLFVLAADGWTLPVGADIDLAPGEQIVITYDATIDVENRDGEVLTNIVDVDWTSLDNTATDGIDAADTGERGGFSDLDTDNPGGDPNDYEDTADADMPVNLTPVFDFEKRITGTSIADTAMAGGTDAGITDLVIGETVTYELVATLPRGTVDNVRIIDQLALANGLLDITNVQISAGSALTLPGGAALTTVSPSVIDSATEDGYDDRVVFNFGTVINTPPVTPVAGDDQIVITITALVVNDIANQQGDVITNTGQLRFLDDDNGNGTRTEQVIEDTVDVEIVEPQVVTNKRITAVLPSIEAGVVVPYEVTLTNNGDTASPTQPATAYELSARDTLPADLILQTASFTAVLNPASDNTDISGLFNVSATGWEIQAGADIDLAPGDVIQVNYNTIIAVTVNEGDLLTNEVDTEWSSINGADSNERGGDGDLDTESDPLNDYESGDAVTIQADLAPTITKRVLGSTAASTASGTDPLIEDLTIGEGVTYEIVITLGRGTTENVRFFDQFSIDEGITAISTVFVEAGTDLSIEGGGPLPTNATVTDNLGGTDGFLDTIELNFGNIVNSASGGETNQEQIRILVVAAVTNVTENQQGDVIENTADLTYVADPDGDGNRTDETISDNAFIEIVEPQVDANKVTTSVPSPAEAGETISYRVTLTNPGGPTNLEQNVTAFGVTAQDVLPAGLEMVPGTFLATRGAVDISAGFDTSESGWAIASTTDIDLAPGEVITITYDAVILDTVRDGDALTNEVDVEWRSLDGNFNTGPTGMRGGDGDLDTTAGSGNPNDYEDNDTATVRADLTPVFEFEKRVLSTSATHTDETGGTDVNIEDLVIGETVTYELVATLGRGTTDGIRIVDQLSIANGLLDITNVSISGGAALSLPSGTIGAITPTITDSLVTDTYRDRVEFNIGTVTNDPSLVTDAASEQIRILITAVVVNDIANQVGDVIANTGTFFYEDDPDNDGIRDEQFIESTANVEIVEPVVNTSKTITLLPLNPTAGERVEYEVVLSNPAPAGSENIIAFDVTSRDDLPDNLSMDVSTFEARVNGTLIANTLFDLTTDGWSISTPSGIDLNQGENLVITYDAVIQPGVQDGENLLNEVDTEWTSLDGTVLGERSGSGDLDSETPAGQPNDYESGDTADFDAEFTSAFAFDKSIVSTSENTGSTGGTSAATTDLVIGETVTYALTATLGRGTTDGVRINDQLSVLNGILDITNVQIIAGSALNLGSGNPFTSITPAITDNAGGNDGYLDRIEINFGTVVNDATATTLADEQIQILVTAHVVNIVANTAGDVIENTADFFYFDDPGGTGIQSEQTIQDTENVEILEPNLSITKAVDNNQPRLNEVLTYTLTVTNNTGASTTDAFDLVIDDLMDPRMTLDISSINLVVNGSPANPSSIVSNSSTLNNLVLGIDRLDEGQSIDITYEVRVSSDIADFDAEFRNDVDLNYTSTEGPNGDERGGDPNTNDPNDPDTYTDDDDVTVEVFQPDLRIEKVDFDAEITPGSLITYQMTVTNQGRAEALGVNVTDDISHFLEAGFIFLDNGPNATLTDGIVTFTLPDMAVNDVQVITMILEAPDVIPAGLESITNIAVANHDDIDPTPPDNEDPEETPVIAIPDLVVTKDDGLLLALTGDEITYVITFTNVGDQIASGVIIEDILPPGMEFISATNGGTLRGNSVFWEIDELAPGEVRTVEVVAEVIRPGLKINTVTIKDDGRGGPDPTPENNKDIDETQTEWRFRYDLTQDFRTRDGNQTLHEQHWGSDRILRREPVILATYMASGLAQAGSTITLEVYDERGQLIADTSVVADAGGNWLASFPMADVEKQPARIEMKQTWASYNPAGERSYNFRTYFGPAFSTGTYYTEQLTVLSVMEKRNPTEVIDLYESAKMLLAMDWNGQLYEFAARGALQSSSGN